MIDVRIGTGSFQDFEVLVDEKWPVIPRVGETIILDPNGVRSFETVREVAYQVARDDQLFGVLVLV